MFGRKKTQELREIVVRQKRKIEQLEQEKNDLANTVKRLQNEVEDSYRSYPKIEFLTKAYTSILADIKKQMDAVILSVKYASEKIVRSDIGMLDTEAVMARAFSRVMRMSQQEIENELAESILEETEMGTLTFYDADEFNSSREYGFRNNKTIRDIALPDGIQKIKRGFFYGCTNLRRLHIPSSVEYIEDYAFFGCTSLSKLEFGLNSRLTEIGDYAFSSCISLNEIELPDGIKSIDTAAFRECRTLKSVRCIGDSIERIGNHVFQNCEELEGFTIPPEVSVMQTSMFSGCKKIEKIVVPESVELVMDYVFQGCSGLKELQFESGQTGIGCHSLDGVPNETIIMVEGHRLEKKPVIEHEIMLGELICSEES